MKFFKKILHYWIAFASLLSFLGGWIILAHSPKPIQTESVTVQSTAPLPPIQAYDSNNSNNNDNLSFFPGGSQSNQPSAGMPTLRTRGS